MLTTKQLIYLSHVINVKLKTNNIKKWIDAHRLKYNSEYGKNDNVLVKWETKPNCLTLRILEKSKSKFVVSFYSAEGSILVQGDWYNQWADRGYKC